MLPTKFRRAFGQFRQFFLSAGKETLDFSSKARFWWISVLAARALFRRLDIVLVTLINKDSS